MITQFSLFPEAPTSDKPTYSDLENEVRKERSSRRLLSKEIDDLMDANEKLQTTVTDWRKRHETLLENENRLANEVKDLRLFLEREKVLSLRLQAENEVQSMYLDCQANLLNDCHHQLSILVKKRDEQTVN